MLELIFQGFSEWLYGLALEAWEYFASAILDVMSLDFAYLEQHIPVITSIRQILLAGGWALLIGNLAFQALKGMATGLGFEGEDPKLLFTRTFVFSFLLMASSQICDTCLDMTSFLMGALKVPVAVDVHLVDSSAFGSLAVSWLLVIIFNIIIMIQVFKLLVETAERYVILSVLTISAPLAFGVGGSRSTSDIFTGWCRMYGSMCVLMMSHIVIMKMLLSVLSAVPSGLDTLLWMVLVLSIIKVAKKADSIITRIGLNPAFTGDSLRVVPGALSYVVLRQAASQITKTLGKTTGGSGRGRSAGTSPHGWGPRSGGPWGTGGSGGGSYAYYNSPSTASASSTTTNPSSSTSSSKVAASAASAVSSTTVAPLIAPTGGRNPALPGAVPPNPSPGQGPSAPISPVPGVPAPQSQQNRLSAPNGQKGSLPPDGGQISNPQRVSGSRTPTAPTPSGASPHLSATPAGTPQNGIPGQPGTAGTTPSSVYGPSTVPGQLPAATAEKLSKQTAQRLGVNSPSKSVDRQLGTMRASLVGATDPGTAVTTQERTAEARFSHREAHTPGRASSLSVQGGKSSKEPISTEQGKASPQSTRFTARPSTPTAPGTAGMSRPDSAHREHISTLEVKAERQTVRQNAAPAANGAKAPQPLTSWPAPTNHVRIEQTAKHPASQPGTAGKPPASAAAPPPTTSRQGRNGAPAPTHPSTTTNASSPAQQEGRSPARPLASSPAPTLQPGTAGNGVLAAPPSLDRAPRQGRNETAISSHSPVSTPTSSPARQESRPSVPAQPRHAAPTQRPSPGTAETARSHEQATPPVQPTTSPSRPVWQPSPAVKPTPMLKPTSPTAKVAPAVKSPPKPTDTRLKKGYPEKSSKGGKKHHGK